MRNFLVLLLLVAGGGVAVQWDIEQVTGAADAYSFGPVLALDNQGFAHILYYQWSEAPILKVASNVTGVWKTRQVMHLTEAFGEIYSIDVDLEGLSYVAYMDSTGPGKYDIFLATDTTGSFMEKNLTDDDIYQFAPVLALHHDVVPNLLYVSEMQLWHGLDNGFDFYKEQVCDNYMQDDWYDGTDYALDPEGGGAAFYIGDDGFLWHARWIVPYESSLPLWDMIQLTDTESFWPSAQSEGFIMHVAYTSGFYPNQIHYMKGSGIDWVDEAASTTGPEETMNERPSLALGPEYDPHIVWMRQLQIGDTIWQYDLRYTHKTPTGWEEEAVTSTPGFDEKPGYGHYFAIDAQGYGHIVWSAPDTVDWIDHIYYAKSKEPIAAGIAECLPQITPMSVAVIGSDVRFSVPQSGNIRLSLYDATGARVQEIASGFYTSGQHVISFNRKVLPAGVYFINVQQETASQTVKFVVTK